MGGANVDDFLDEMFYGRSHWSCIEEPQGGDQDKQAGGILIAMQRWHNNTDSTFSPSLHRELESKNQAKGGVNIERMNAKTRIYEKGRRISK